MAFQKGPGEGYGAAKTAALAIDPSLKCRALYWNLKIDGYVVETPAGKNIGTGRISRDAWQAALVRMETP